MVRPGIWKLRITDSYDGNDGTLRSWRIKAFGHGFVPGFPEIDQLISGPGSLAVSWKAPADSGREGTAITSYDLRYIDADADDFADSNWTEVIGAGGPDDRAYTLSGLDGETKYRVQIRAVNGDGHGPWSPFDSEETLRAKPDPPRGLSVAARNQALAVTWSLPAYAGSSEPTEYDLRHIRSDAPDKSDGFWTNILAAWATADGERRYLVQNLENGVQYDIQMRSRNVSGDSGWSGTARGTPANINGPAEFPGNESGVRSIAENTPAGVDIGDPIAARDDEGDALTYALGNGSASFAIDPASGQLRTVAALDHETTDTYSVTVTVSDLKARDGTTDTAIDDTITVTINVTDVDEPPSVSGPANVTVPENQARVGTYSATDPERAINVFRWSLAGTDAGSFEIDQSGKLSFKPPPDFETPRDSAPLNIYELKVVANDDGAAEPSARNGELAVRVTVEDVDEPPSITGPSSHTMAENSTQTVGSFQATDPEGSDATWLSLQGADARFFELNASRVLSFVDTPDFDRVTNGNHGPDYQVTLRAADEGNRIAQFEVTITLTNVPEGPRIEGPTEVALNEVINPSPGQVVRVGTYSKVDPEGSGTNWGAVGDSDPLGGPDAGAFTFNQLTGVLAFASPPDFEFGGGFYQVTLSANDGALSESIDITINVINVDETGELGFSTVQPQASHVLTATLSDPDRVISTTWTWERSVNRSNWAPLSGASSTTTTSGYTPLDDDLGHYLRVTANYEDGYGPNKSLTETSANLVRTAPGMNNAPVFADRNPERSVAENAPPDSPVGSPVTATDPGDPLAYELTGSDDFEINPATGQIRVARGAMLDHETTPAVQVTVNASDPSDATDSVTVAISINDVNERPITVGDAVSLNEDFSVVIDVLANDRDPENGPLTLAGSLARSPRHGTAVIDAMSNRITYTPRADYYGADNFAYTARDDGSPVQSSTANVNVTINPINDAPVFPAPTESRSVSEESLAGQAIGDPIAASDVDGDRLTYSSRNLPVEFGLDDETGQLSVAQGAVLDSSVRDTYTFEVTATDPEAASASVTVTVTVTSGPSAVARGGGGGGGGGGGPRPSSADFAWTVDRDLDILADGQSFPAGLYSDGQVLWITENGAGDANGLFAYALANGRRLESYEFALDPVNRDPRGVWGDGIWLWISDSGQDRVYVYGFDGVRQRDREFAFVGRNADARGIFGIGDVLWVLDGGKNSLFAYRRSDGELLGEFGLSARNANPHGLYSDGFTVWVSDHDEERLYAYRLPVVGDGVLGAVVELERVRDEVFAGLGRAGNSAPRGIWANSELMYVVDAARRKVFTYNMPDAADARLLELELSGVLIGEFAPGRFAYRGLVTGDVQVSTVSVQAAQEDAVVLISPADADPLAPGHQVEVDGPVEVAVEVVSADGSRRQVYRVVIGSGYCLVGDELCLGTLALGGRVYVRENLYHDLAPGNTDLHHNISNLDVEIWGVGVVRADFLDFFNRTGGVERWGFPTSEVVEIEPGTLTQFFQRGVVDFHDVGSGWIVERRLTWDYVGGGAGGSVDQGFEAAPEEGPSGGVQIGAFGHWVADVDRRQLL